MEVRSGFAEVGAVSGPAGPVKLYDETWGRPTTTPCLLIMGWAPNARAHRLLLGCVGSGCASSGLTTGGAHVGLSTKSRAVARRAALWSAAGPAPGSVCQQGARPGIHGRTTPLLCALRDLLASWHAHIVGESMAA